MTEKDYFADKKNKKKSAVKVVWVLVLMGIVFVFIVAKFAFSGTFDDVIGGAPTSDDVYSIAKDFVRPTLKAEDADFSDSEYQFGKKEDSVYVIKSVVETKTHSGDVVKTNFEITLKFKGGSKKDQSSWELLNLNED